MGSGVWWPTVFNILNYRYQSVLIQSTKKPHISKKFIYASVKAAHSLYIGEDPGRSQKARLPPVSCPVKRRRPPPHHISSPYYLDLIGYAAHGSRWHVHACPFPFIIYTAQTGSGSDANQMFWFCRVRWLHITRLLSNAFQFCRFCRVFVSKVQHAPMDLLGWTLTIHPFLTCV